MKISRFYQDQTLKVGEEITLSAANHRHAIQVLRLKTEETLILFNGKGGEFHARIINADRKNSIVILESFDPVDRESTLDSEIIIAMIKSDKMDFAIQKLVELGVNKIQPMYTKRSVIRVKANRLEKKMAHWQGIIISACEQSGRTVIPIINEPLTIEECIKTSAKENNIKNSFIMHPGSKKRLDNIKNIKNKVALFVGPEGGFTTGEEELIQEENTITPISFGKRILRAETAAISGLTACQLYWGDI